MRSPGGDPQGRRGAPSTPAVMESLVDAHDILFVLLTIVVFVFLALCARAAEKL